MSIDKVASALLLHSTTVQALESDAYERLPAPTFVRGYLRGYARVLGLPSGPVLEMFDRQGFEPPPLSTDATESTQAHTSDTVVRLVTYAVAVVLVLLVGLWWHSQEDGGFGIAGDLFDRSSETEQDPTALNAGESGTTPGDGDTEGASVAMVSGQADRSPQDDGIRFPLSVQDAESTEHTAGEAAPHDTDAAGSTSAGAGTADAPAADQAADTATARAGAQTESGVTAAAATDTSQRDEDSAVTAPVTETAPGEIVEVVPTPTPRPGTTSTGQGSGQAASSEEAASDTLARAGSAPGELPGSEATAERGTPASQVGPLEAVAGADPAVGAGPETAPVGADGGETAGAIAPETSAATRDDGAGPGPGTTSGQTGLVLEFVHESWVEVYDRERTRLFFGLVQPGRVLSFDGPQPFDILLGYGKDVRVAIDGRSFDHTPFLKHGVARFSIGEGPDDGVDVAETAVTPEPTDDGAPETESEPNDRGG